MRTPNEPPKPPQSQTEPVEEPNKPPNTPEPQTEKNTSSRNSIRFETYLRIITALNNRVSPYAAEKIAWMMSRFEPHIDDSYVQGIELLKVCLQILSGEDISSKPIDEKMQDDIIRLATNRLMRSRPYRMVGQISYGNSGFGKLADAIFAARDFFTSTPRIRGSV